MTNKIALEALKLAGFKNPTAIAEILNYVPNPSTALEILLGVYEPIVVNPAERFRTHKYSSYKKIAELVSYDELGNTVTYKVYEPKMQNVYFLTKEDKDKNVFTTDRPRDYHSWDTIQVAGYTERETTCTIESLNDSFKDVIPTELAFAKLEEWDTYGKPKYEYTHEDVFGGDLV